MAKRRIWKNKPPEEIARRKGLERIRRRPCGASAFAELRRDKMARQGAHCGTVPVPPIVEVDYEVLYAGLPEADRAVARSLMGRHGMSMAGAVGILNSDCGT